MFKVLSEFYREKMEGGREGRRKENVSDRIFRNQIKIRKN